MTNQRTTGSAVNQQEIREAIQEAFSEVFRAKVTSSEPPVLEDSSVLLDSGLDSLGFAILVARLEEHLGYDPFSLSDEAYYPRTFGELVDYYRRFAP